MIAVAAPLISELPVGTSAIKFDLSALVEGPVALLRVPLYLPLFLLIRGLPVLLYRRDLKRSDLLPFALYSGTALPRLRRGPRRRRRALRADLPSLLALLLRRRAPLRILMSK